MNQEPDQAMLAGMMAQMGLITDDVRAFQQRMGLQAPSRRRCPPAISLDMSPEELRARMKEYKVWFEAERQLPPEPAPYVPRSILVSSQLNVRRIQEQEYRKKGDVWTRMTIVGYAKNSSATAMSLLQPITISKMFVRKTHVGRYLLCRLIAPCARLTAIQATAEDSEGTAFDLSIYNFPTAFDCSPDYLDALLPLGTTIAIREPTWKPATQGPYPIVRVDSPTDITIVGPHNRTFDASHWSTGHRVAGSPPTPSTVEGWKARGNALFKASQWLPAALAYSHGIALDPDAIVLYLNRSEAYLRLKFYSGALSDVRRVLSAPAVPDTLRGKALAREGKAEYARGNFLDAERKFDAWARMHPDDREIPTWIARCQQRSRESRTGDYDLAHLFKLSLNEPHLDVADYQGPIELASKPFVSVYKQDLPKDEIMLVTNLLTMRIETRTQSATMSHVMQKIYGNPELHALVFDLYAGPDYPHPPLSYPPVIPQEPVPVNILSPAVDIDAAHLHAICSLNNFSPTPLRPNNIAYTGKPQSASDDTGLDPPSGLYLLPSLFNHACVGNATWHCVGDVMIIRAMEHIRAGDEITIPYCFDFSYEKRAESLQNRLPGDCGCRLCTEDRKDAKEARMRRDKLAEELTNDRLRQGSLARLRVLEARISATYSPSRGPIRPLMATVYHCIAEMLRVQGGPRALKEAVSQSKRALQSLGFVLLEKTSRGTSPASANSPMLPIATDSIPATSRYSKPIFIIIRMAQDFLVLKDEANAVKWLKAALWILDTTVGGGKELFTAVLEPTLQYLDLKKFAKRVL